MFRRQTPVAPSPQPDIPPAPEVVWTNLSDDDTLLSPRRVLEASQQLGGTEDYGALALSIAPLQAAEWRSARLSVSHDESGAVIGHDWSGKWIEVHQKDKKVPLQRAAAEAGAMLVRAGLLQRIELTAVHERPNRTELAIGFGAVTTEAVQSSMFHRFGEKPLSGALGKAISALAIAAHVPNLPNEHDTQPFKPDDSWVHIQNLLRLAKAAGLNQDRIDRMLDKIDTLLAEQLCTGEPIPNGEVTIEGKCSLAAGAGRNCSWEFLGRGSFVALAYEYPSTPNSPQYQQLMAFFSKMAGVYIMPRPGIMHGNERRRRRLAKNF